MPLRHGHVHRILEQEDELEPADGLIGNRRPLGPRLHIAALAIRSWDGDTSEIVAERGQRIVRERQIQLPGSQGWERVDRIGHLDRDLDRGVPGPELGDREGHDRGSGRGKRAEAQTPALETGERLELEFERGQLPEQCLAPLHQQAAGVGQNRALGRAADEDRADLRLQGGYLPRHGRLRVPERLGRARERALPGDLAQNLEAADIEHAI